MKICLQNVDGCCIIKLYHDVFCKGFFAKNLGSDYIVLVKQKVYALNGYPHGKGKTNREPLIRLENTNITLSSLRMVDDGVYAIRLLNNFDRAVECSCKIFDKQANLTFGKYEAKTLIYKDGELTEHDSMLYL